MREMHVRYVRSSLIFFFFLTTPREFTINENLVYDKVDKRVTNNLFNESCLTFELG